MAAPRSAASARLGAYGSTRVTIEATPGRLAEVLDGLLSERSAHQDLAAGGRNYVERCHSVRLSAERIAQFLGVAPPRAQPNHTRRLGEVIDGNSGPGSPGSQGRVAMLVRNTVEFDTRVRKEAEVLATRGWEVCVFGVAAEHLPPTARQAGVEYRRVHVGDRASESYRGLRERWAGIDRRRLELLCSRRAAGRARDQVIVGAAEVLLRRLSRMRLRGLKHAYGSLKSTLRPLTQQLDFLQAVGPGVQVLQPDVVHAHDLNTLLAGYLLHRRSGARLVYDAHELEMETDRDWTRGRRIVSRCIEALGTRAADQVITVSPGIAEELATTYRIPPPRVVLNSAPLSAAEERPAADLRKAAGVGPTEKLIVYAGRIAVEGRGLDRLLEAIALMNHHFHVGFMGPRSDQTERALRAAIARLGLTSRAHLFDPVPAAQVPATIATADAAVLTTPNTCRSHDLSLPNKLFDAVMGGVPLAVSGLRHIREFVEGFQLGVVFDETQPSSIAEALVQVTSQVPAGLRDGDRLRQLQQAVAWEAQALTLRVVYEELAAL